MNNTATEVTITRSMVNYGLPLVMVEPYETVTRTGERVEVEEFLGNGGGKSWLTYVEAKAWRFKANGQRYARWSWQTVAVPTNVQAALLALGVAD